MWQIIQNALYIFVIPLLIGIIIRFLCRHIKRAYFITVIFMILAGVAWIAYYVIPSHGSELYGIIAIRITCVAAGMLLMGLIMRLRKIR